MINFIKNNISSIGFVVALGIISYLLMNPRIEHVPIEYEEDETMRDTTTVVKTVTDTVTVYDTTTVELAIPEPISQDSVNKYTTKYSDSFISAEITSKVRGTLESQELWYVKRVEHIKTDHWQRTTINRYLKPTRTFIEDKSIRELWLGGTIEGKSFTPNIMYRTNNIAYEVGYDLNGQSTQEFQLKALRVGVKIKLF